MRHAKVDLEKKKRKKEETGVGGLEGNKEEVLLDLGILATTEKWSSNCVKVGDRKVCQN